MVNAAPIAVETDIASESVECRFARASSARLSSNVAYEVRCTQLGCNLSRDAGQAGTQQVNLWFEQKTLWRAPKRIGVHHS